MTLPDLTTPDVFIFDFDGVILDSARLKAEAFVRCYSGESNEALAAITAYQERHGGIGRREKFEHFEREIFGRAGDEASIDALYQRYAALIDEDMLGAPLIPGAEQALRALHGRKPLHLVSGMPEAELKPLLVRRGLDHFFVSVAGSPKTKKPEFERILTEGKHAASDALAIGDSLTEFKAAKALGIPFLAIVAKGAPDFFPPDVPRLPDLTELLAFTEA